MNTGETLRREALNGAGLSRVTSLARSRSGTEFNSVSSKLGPRLRPDLPRGCGVDCVGVTVSGQGVEMESEQSAARGALRKVLCEEEA